jgi:hypothetical protein
MLVDANSIAKLRSIVIRPTLLDGEVGHTGYSMRMNFRLLPDIRSALRRLVGRRTRGISSPGNRRRAVAGDTAT